MCHLYPAWAEKELEPGLFFLDLLLNVALPLAPRLEVAATNTFAWGHSGGLSSNISNHPSWAVSTSGRTSSSEVSGCVKE